MRPGAKQGPGTGGQLHLRPLPHQDRARLPAKDPLVRRIGGQQGFTDRGIGLVDVIQTGKISIDAHLGQIGQDQIPRGRDQQKTEREIDQAPVRSQRAQQAADQLAVVDLAGDGIGVKRVVGHYCASPRSLCRRASSSSCCI